MANKIFAGLHRVWTSFAYLFGIISIAALVGPFLASSAQAEKVLRVGLQ